MKIDKLTTLAFAMYSNQGAYALFLGAGISRAAHVKAGWEIEEELISRLGKMKGATADDGKWHEWYEREYGEKVNYSELLDSLTNTSTERVALLSEFFEPTMEEKELGWKQPTAAHKALAKLVKGGYVKVIITTNFDRLIETALQQEGITPQTVYNEGDLKQITPLAHAERPTVIKVNGDYIDCKFRNTTEELDKYPESMEAFLKHIFENYGLITCGWSAKYDVGLKRIMNGADESRYGLFLSEIGEPNDVQIELVNSRNGDTLNIKDADNFFDELSERIFALERIYMTRNLTHDVIIARVEKYLSSPQYDIAYNKLVKELTNNAYEKIMEKANYNFVLNAESFAKYDDLHYEAVKPLMEIAILVAEWGRPKHFKPLGEALVELCTFPNIYGTKRKDTVWVHALAPSLLLYTLGVACVKNERFAELDRVLKLQVPKENFFSFRREKLLYLITPNHWDRNKWKEIIGSTRYYLPSLYYYRKLWPLFTKEFPSESEFDNYFNIWERLMSLLYGYNECNSLGFYIPIGYFILAAFEYEKRELGNSPYCEFWDGAEKLKDKWPPIAQGMFGGSYKEYQELEKMAEDYYKKSREF